MPAAGDARPQRRRRSPRPGTAAAGAAAVGRTAVAPPAGASISDEARAKFNVGVNLLTDPDGPRYEEAYRAFKAAYALSPSYKILGNLGLCAMKLERDDEAIAAYEKYVAEGKDLSRAEVQQITSDLATLRSSVAHVVVESDPPGAEIIDVRVPVRGERVLNSYGTVQQATKLGLHEGAHQVTARLEGYPDQTWDVEVAGGQDFPPHKFVFTKEAPATSMNSRAVGPAHRPVAAGPGPRLDRRGGDRRARRRRGRDRRPRHREAQRLRRREQRHQSGQGARPSRIRGRRSTSSTTSASAAPSWPPASPRFFTSPDPRSRRRALRLRLPPQSHA